MKFSTSSNLCRISPLLEIIIIVFVVSGCSLVTYSHEAFMGNGFEWHLFKGPAIPKNPAEEAAINAAKLKGIVKVGDIMAVPLAANEHHQLIVTSEGKTGASNPMAPKKITYYRIGDEKIQSFTTAIMEPSPDADYEQTIYKAGQKSRLTGLKEVIIYSRPDQNLTVVGDAKRCIAKVNVYAGFDSAGECISIRIFDLCDK